MFKLAQIVILISNILMGILYIGTLFELATKWFGILGFVLFALMVPLFSPSLLFFPWFEAWASQNIINESILWIWGVWISLQVSALLFSIITAHKEQNLVKRYNKLRDE